MTQIRVQSGPDALHDLRIGCWRSHLTAGAFNCNLWRTIRPWRNTRSPVPSEDHQHPARPVGLLRQQLKAKGQESCHGIEEIARDYRTYLELTRHWNRVLPMRVLWVSYEDLVEDLGAGERPLLAHCAVEFDPA